MAAHPWFVPVQRRIAILAVVTAWLGIEAWVEPMGSWFMLAIGLLAWGVWDFFLSGNYRTDG